jgi:effector-binding domain-containing protein
MLLFLALKKNIYYKDDTVSFYNNIKQYYIKLLDYIYSNIYTLLDTIITNKVIKTINKRTHYNDFIYKYLIIYFVNEYIIDKYNYKSINVIIETDGIYINDLYHYLKLYKDGKIPCTITNKYL